MSTVSETARWWARTRAFGPLLVAPGTALPPGLLRLPDPQGAWVLPAVPTAAGPTGLAELGLSGTGLEQPNVTARVLAAVLKCCWTVPDGPVWPGEPAAWSTVLGVFRHYADGEDEVMRRSATGAARRLVGAGWMLREGHRPDVVRLGPRVATWSAPDLVVLREMLRTMPAPVVPGTQEPLEQADPA